MELGSTSVRRLWVLVRGLPAHALVWREDTAGWGNQEELTARAIEVVDAWGRTLASLLWGGFRFKGQPKLGAPIRIEHPGRIVPKKEITKDPEEIRRFFDRL